MLATDRDALTCDLAETYGIFDMQGMPVKLLASLACGLREDSRIKMRMEGARVDNKTLLLACIADALNLLVWARTKKDKTGTGGPKSFVKALTQEPSAEKKQIQGFSTGEEFDAYWKSVTGGGTNGK